MGDAPFASVSSCQPLPCQNMCRHQEWQRQPVSELRRSAARPCWGIVPKLSACSQLRRQMAPGMRPGVLLTHDVNSAADADDVPSSERLLQDGQRYGCLRAMDAFKAMGCKACRCCEGEWRGAGGGSDVRGGSRGALRLAGGKGSAQGLERNVEEMRARPKIPDPRPLARSVKLGAGNAAGEFGEPADSVQPAIDKLCAGYRRFCVQAVLAEVGATVAAALEAEVITCAAGLVPPVTPCWASTNEHISHISSTRVQSPLKTQRGILFSQ
ncbi:hypothetical protein FB567DRAFT_79332 [Paraphoma chrysanthemicola]|uniref:Uncharacterized protein n=1 Tax=Paraphoma chrysanthemicola TaxID=798071 RepID=A0A8K0R5A5_9PLEO|nr:hypothetical protein FB567DRAFT_79332 [Paraphoma chrysanthemicola]